MAEPRVTPIQASDLEEVGRFLSENLNRRIAPEAWTQSLQHPWSESRPNFGVQLRDGARLVGVFCAIYSEQTIAGRTERFCNPHSWCVLEEHRRYGIGLVLALLRQRGYHFTMLTPNPKVAEIFRQLRFKDLADGVVRFVNLPSLSALLPGRRLITDPTAIERALSGSTLRDFRLHRDIPWLRFLVFGDSRELCLLVYKRAQWKRLPCAHIVHVSDSRAFARQHRLLRHHLLMREGLVTSRVEARFLVRAPSFAWRSRRTQAKLFLSSTLTDAQIPDLYSELAALDV